MPLIKVREKNQITLPREVMEVLHIQAPDHIEYQIVSDGILIRSPQATTHKQDKLAKIMRLSKPNRTAYGTGTALEIDTFIATNRE